MEKSKTTDGGTEFRFRQLFANSLDETTLAGRSQKRLRLLYAAVLASLIKADHKIQAEELEMFANIATKKLNLPDGGLEVMANFITLGLDQMELEQATESIRQKATIEERAILVANLWELAVSDHELHPDEAAKVEFIAKAIGITELRTHMEKIKATGKAQRATSEM